MLLLILIALTNNDTKARSRARRSWATSTPETCRSQLISPYYSKAIPLIVHDHSLIQDVTFLTPVFQNSNYGTHLVPIWYQSGTHRK